MWDKPIVFKERPIEPKTVVAVQWTGRNHSEVQNFVGVPVTFRYPEEVCSIRYGFTTQRLNVGDYIMRVNGEFSFWSREDFDLKYEAV